VADAGLAGHADVALVRLDADVTGRAAVAGPQVVTDLDAAALGVVELQRVHPHLVVQVLGDVEGAAGLAVGGQRVAGAGLLVGAEVDAVHLLARALVQAARDAPAVRDRTAGGVLELPLQRLGGLGDHGRVLGAGRQVADHVDAHAGAGVRLVLLGLRAASQRHVVHAEPPGLGAAADLERDLRVGQRYGG